MFQIVYQNNLHLIFRILSILIAGSLQLGTDVMISLSLILIAGF